MATADLANHLPDEYDVPLVPTVIVEVTSSTRPGVVYQITRAPEGGLACTCKGYTFRRDCKHVRAFTE